MDEVPRVFSISDIQMEMEGRVYASCVRSSMTYGSETMPLLVDVWYLIERQKDKWRIEKAGWSWAYHNFH